MAQNYFSIVTNKGRNKLALSAAGGAAVTITHFAIGDGNGAEVNPTAASTALVREVWRTPVESVVIDPLNPSAVLVTSIIPTTAGGWWMREFGIFDVVGDMVAVAKPVSQYKPTALEGQLEDIRYEFQIIIGETANVTMLVDPSVLLASRAWVESRKVPVAQLSLTPWVPVKSMTLTAPPTNPTAWDTYLIPAGATSVWNGHAQKLAEWNGQTWNIITPQNGHGISLPDGRVFERVNGVYVEKIALDSQSGKWNYATASGTANSVVSNLDPAPQSLGFGFWLRLKITATNTMAVTLNVNALGAKPVLRIDGAALIEGDLSNGDIAELVYDGNAWRLVSYCRSLLPRPLGSNQTFFVRPDGNDTNNGLANTSGSAFKTLEGAWAAVSTRYAPSDKYAIIFQLAPGTYEGAMFSGYSGSVIVIGNASDRGSYKIVEPAGKNFCVSANQGKVEYRGVTIRSQSSAGTQVLMVWAASTVSVTLTDCRIEVPISNSNLSIVYASSGAIVDVRGSIEISGGNGRSDISAVISTESGALFSGGLYAAPVTWTIYNLGCQQAWANADSLSFQSWLAVTFSKIGSQFAGRRFNATKNAVITTGGGGENFFPGDQGGSIDAGGVYL
ncbi:phage tail protein [Ochrobactrum sp. BTU2]|uniref:phage tail protein n=1 Tax=Ochrobactrum sp. BTU2 TaxID=2856166 RepID=UPI00211A9F6D|nr:phage tail protein [Ochrobactrum sp. BTU2]MCQ9145837.1 phage tail protein [Ochrobactrum sp. BTU2]